MVFFCQQLDSFSLLVYCRFHFLFCLRNFSIIFFNRNRARISKEQVSMLSSFIDKFQVLSLLHFILVSEILIFLSKFLKFNALSVNYLKFQIGFPKCRLKLGNLLVILLKQGINQVTLKQSILGSFLLEQILLFFLHILLMLHLVSS